jgi:hypothetical protein
MRNHFIAGGTILSLVVLCILFLSPAAALQGIGLIGTGIVVRFRVILLRTNIKISKLSHILMLGMHSGGHVQWAVGCDSDRAEGALDEFDPAALYGSIAVQLRAVERAGSGAHGRLCLGPQPARTGPPPPPSTPQAAPHAAPRARRSTGG